MGASPPQQQSQDIGMALQQPGYNAAMCVYDGVAAAQPVIDLPKMQIHGTGGVALQQHGYNTAMCAVGQAHCWLGAAQQAHWDAGPPQQQSQDIGMALQQQLSDGTPGALYGQEWPASDSAQEDETFGRQ
jgi:hypothetical protein